ncbi:MAG: SMI1/KNR4 family protein [Caulobacterales bacterium]|jgi:hypothetical protein|nr:SMI1/KNR4 family protein [Caulobacterales bacterium]
MTYAAFIQKWADAEKAPTPVAADDLAAAERRLGIAFPKIYREALLQLGAASATLELLDIVAERGLETGDIQDFMTDDEIVATTETWRQLGLPRDCIAFARDSGGDLYCFRRGGEAVWFWDIEARAVEKTAPSFAAWIAGFCAIDRAGA